MKAIKSLLLFLLGAFSLTSLLDAQDIVGSKRKYSDDVAQSSSKEIKLQEQLPSSLETFADIEDMTDQLLATQVLADVEIRSGVVGALLEKYKVNIFFEPEVLSQSNLILEALCNAFPEGLFKRNKNKELPLAVVLRQPPAKKDMFGNTIGVSLSSERAVEIATIFLQHMQRASSGTRIAQHLNKLSKNDRTPLMHAAMLPGDHYPFITLLLAAGSNPGKRNAFGDSAIALACQAHNLISAKVMFAHFRTQSPIDFIMGTALPNRAKKTLMHIVAEHGDAELVRTLIISGGISNPLNQWEATPLMVANSLTLPVLVGDPCVNCFAQDNFKNTVLHYTARNGNRDNCAEGAKRTWTLLSCLIQRYPASAIKKLIDTQNNRGATALHHAACLANSQVVEALLTLGADAMLRSDDARKPSFFGRILPQAIPLDLVVTGLKEKFYPASAMPRVAHTAQLLWKALPAEQQPSYQAILATYGIAVA